MYHLMEANRDSWVKYYRIYNNTNLIQWLTVEKGKVVEYYEQIKNTHWITSRDNNIVAGVQLQDNCIVRFFIVPPHEDLEGILKFISERLLQKFDSVIVRNIPTRYEKSFYKQNYKLQCQYQVMASVTKKMDISWDNAFIVAEPNLDDIDEMTTLALEGYQQIKSKSQITYEKQKKALQFYFEELENKSSIPKEWSRVVRNRDNNQLVGLCQVNFWRGCPYILELVVHPEFRKRGIARNLLGHILSSAHPEYLAVFLSVYTDNPARQVYHNLGFVGYDAMSEFILMR